MRDEEREGLEHAIAAFIGAFEVVFHYEWEYAREVLTRDIHGFLIRPEGTFLEPRVGNQERESAEWGERAILLQTYRELKALMQQRGISSVLPEPWNEAQAAHLLSRNEPALTPIEILPADIEIVPAVLVPS